MRYWFLFVLLFCLNCTAGIVSPLYVGNITPILNEYKQPLKGTWGEHTNECCLIEIRFANDGIIRPPYKDGSAHPLNPLLRASKSGLNACGENTGLFCEIFTKRIDPTNKIFARAYNDSTIEKSSFYSDTPVYEIPSGPKSTLALDFDPIRPIDPDDDDNGGLNNSWEKSLGTYDKFTSDYDNDGASDYEEMLAGTNPKDANSIFRIESINHLSNQTEIVWTCVPTRKYQIQRTLNLTEPFTNFNGIITPNSSQYLLQRIINDTNMILYYRVVIITE